MINGLKTLAESIHVASRADLLAQRGTLVAVSISAGGIPKRPVGKARLEVAGLVGDLHSHAKHNRPDRAVSILDVETLFELVDEGFDVEPGTLGENLTVAGLDLKACRSGDVLRIGDVVLRLEQPRQPCYVLDAVAPQLQHLLVGRCGWMASVIRPGTLSSSMTIQIESGRVPLPR